jgi:hypothetical protein
LQDYEFETRTQLVNGDERLFPHIDGFVKFLLHVGACFVGEVVHVRYFGDVRDFGLELFLEILLRVGEQVNAGHDV